MSIILENCATRYPRTRLTSLSPSTSSLGVTLLKIALHVTFISEHLSHMLHNELTRYSLEKDFGSASPPMDVDLEANFVADGQADGDDSMSDQV